jgi:hypothetical protein
MMNKLKKKEVRVKVKRKIKVMRICRMQMRDVMLVGTKMQGSNQKDKQVILRKLKRKEVESLRPSIYSSNKNRRELQRSSWIRDRRKCKKQKMKKKYSKEQMSSSNIHYLKHSCYILKN